MSINGINFLENEKEILLRSFNKYLYIFIRDLLLQYLLMAEDTVTENIPKNSV